MQIRWENCMVSTTRTGIFNGFACEKSLSLFLSFSIFLSLNLIYLCFSLSLSFFLSISLSLPPVFLSLSFYHPLPLSLFLALSLTLPLQFKKKRFSSVVMILTSSWNKTIVTMMTFYIRYTRSAHLSYL